MFKIKTKARTTRASAVRSKNFIRISTFQLISALAAALLAAFALSCGNESKSFHHDSGEDIKSGIDVEGVIEQLQAVEVPAGADESVWRALVARFERDLMARGGGRLASRVPGGDANRIDDLELVDIGGGETRLEWTYRNVGDYDQNGTVGISDITQIALHYLHSRDGGGNWPDAQDEIIDGDGDGVIGVADVTPIALNYLAQINGYNVQTSSNPGGPWTNAEFVQLPQPPASGRLILSVPVPEDAQDFVRVVPEGPDFELGDASNVVTVATDLPPVIFGINRSEGNAGEATQFIASVAGTPPITVDWDFGGAATPDTAQGTNVQVTLGGAGEYTITVTASNEFGEDVQQFPLTVVLFGDPPEITSISPTLVQGGEEVAISATVIGTEPFSYEWNFGGGAEPGDSTDASPVIMPGESGQYDASLTVTNLLGSDTSNFTLTVSDEDISPPIWDTTVGITSLNPVQGSDELVAEFGRATDNRDENPVYMIYYNKSSEFDIGNLAGQQLREVTWILHSDPPPYEETISNLEPGESYTFLVRVRDLADPVPNEDENTVTLSQTVDPNLLLVGAILQLPDNDPPIATPITFTASVSGGDGNYTGVWSDGDEEFGFFYEPQTIGSEVTTKWGTAKGNTSYTISVTVTDGEGRMGMKTIEDVFISDGTPLSFETDVYPIISSRCIACHAGSGAPEGLNMQTRELAYANLVGTSSGQQPSLKRIEPFDPEKSYMIHKIVGRAGITGVRMPFGGPYLTSQQINTVVVWTFGGAEP